MSNKQIGPWPMDNTNIFSFEDLINGMEIRRSHFNTTHPTPMCQSQAYKSSSEVTYPSTTG